jgi:hypothetical protein
VGPDQRLKLTLGDGYRVAPNNCGEGYCIYDPSCAGNICAKNGFYYLNNSAQQPILNHCAAVIGIPVCTFQ